jgi:DNA-binding MarR family transcriptional regulator
VTTIATRSRSETIESLGKAFKRTMVAVRRLRGRETHRPGKPSFAQYQLLASLQDTDGLASSELAQAADLSPATVTQMLDALVDLGLVTRIRSETDRRIVTCQLTESGRTLIAERRAVLQRCWVDALAEFSVADLALAAEVFERIATMFDGFDDERLVT